MLSERSVTGAFGRGSDLEFCVLCWVSLAFDCCSLLGLLFVLILVCFWRLLLSTTFGVRTTMVVLRFDGAYLDFTYCFG